MPNPGKPTRRRETPDVTSPKKVLVGIRVTPSFHRRIQTECVRRSLSLQQLVTEALKEFFQTPLSSGHSEIITLGRVEPEVPAEQAAWNDLWNKYLRVMPREKIQVMTSAMEWDLTMRKSSRRRPPVQGLNPEKGGGEQ